MLEIRPNKNPNLKTNKMIRKISAAMLVLALTTSCVSKKMYTELENKFAELKKKTATQDESEDCAKESRP
jgi:chemotaxis protein MotB